MGAEIDLLWAYLSYRNGIITVFALSMQIIYMAESIIINKTNIPMIPCSFLLWVSFFLNLSDFLMDTKEPVLDIKILLEDFIRIGGLDNPGETCSENPSSGIISSISASISILFDRSTQLDSEKL
jgi:carbon starvation protein CstA